MEVKQNVIYTLYDEIIWYTAQLYQTTDKGDMIDIAKSIARRQVKLAELKLEMKEIFDFLGSVQLIKK